MNIYVIWKDWDGGQIEVFGDNVEGYEKAQDFIVKIKNSVQGRLSNGECLEKVILGTELNVEDVEVVSEVKLSIKTG